MNAYPAHISKHKLNQEKPIISLLMDPNEERWHSLAVSKFCIIKRNNAKTWWEFLFSEFSSFF